MKAIEKAIDALEYGLRNLQPFCSAEPLEQAIQALREYQNHIHQAGKMVGQKEHAFELFKPPYGGFDYDNTSCKTVNQTGAENESALFKNFNCKPGMSLKIISADKDEIVCENQYGSFHTYKRTPTTAPNTQPVSAALEALEHFIDDLNNAIIIEPVGLWLSMGQCIDLYDLMKTIKQALTQAQIPDGWVLVPKEPTDKMLASRGGTRTRRYNIYKAMITAAPATKEG